MGIVTSATRSPAELVNLARYPLDNLMTPDAQAFMKQCHAELQRTGACLLPDFLAPDALEAMRAEAEALAPQAYCGGMREGTAYLAPPDESLPEDHPRRILMPSRVGAVAYDLFPPDSPTRRLYEWDGLLDFIAGVVGLGTIYRYADPLGAVNIAVMKDGDRLLWHFDQTDFVTSILLQDCERGGDFEYVPYIRDENDERYDRVGALLKGEANDVIRLDAKPGTFAFFKGRHSIHRVTPIQGEIPRLIALFGYDTKPGTNSTHRLKTNRYGRVG